jgi:predicted AlkP superfamily phosphohydrolase/phosphomutase
MRRPSAPFVLFLAAIALTACRASAPTAPATPRPELHATAQRVVLLSLDGYSAVRHRRLLAAGAYREAAGLAAFESWGYVVEHAIPADPTLTAVSHASIATGAPPALTGIVNNRYHVLGSGITQAISGFSAPLAAEPLWLSFRRAGKRVGVLAYPGCDNTSEARRGDFGTTYVDGPLASPQAVTLAAAAFAPAAPGLARERTFSPPRSARLAVSFAADSGVPVSDFVLTAIDTVDDGASAYDALLVDDDADPGNGVLATAHAGEWFPLSLHAAHADGGERLVGAWCLLQSIAPDLAAVRIYRGAFNATEAYPRAFRERLDAEASFWPGPADDRALERGIAGEGGLAVADYLEQARRFAAYFSACMRVAVAHETFDLLLTYQPIVDEVQHACTISDPRQRFYSEGMVDTAGRTVDQAYLIADAAVADLSLALDLSRDALVVISDHGIAPIWETVHLNEVLRRAGLADQVDRKGRPAVAETSQMVAVASGGCANLYVNLIGREPGGVVPADRVDEVVRKAAQALALVEVDGEPVVEAAYTRAQLAAIGLDAANAGDLVVFMRPGYAATGGIGGATHERASYVGQHGFLATHPEMHAIWVARGAAVPRARRAQAPLTEVAAFVSHLAGVPPPLQARPWVR